MPELDPSERPLRDAGVILHESRTFPSRLSEIQRANSLLVAAIARAPAISVGEALLFDLRLAVTEVFANIVEHSYGSDPDQTIRMSIRIAADRIELGFADVGRRPESRRLRWRNLAEFRERGLGLFLLSKCMDSVTFHFRSDGVNRVHLLRTLGRDATSRGGEHLPFHVAVYDTAEERLICPIGHFARDRMDPFRQLPAPATRRIVFDLTNLDFLDSFGIDCLARHARALWKEGCRLQALEPPAAVARVVRASGLLDLLSPDGWAVRPAEERGGSRPEVPGTSLPLVRALTTSWRASDPADPSVLMASLVPPRFRAGDLECVAVLNWSDPSCGLFVRGVARRDAIEERAAGAAAGGILFLGRFSRPGTRALIAVHQLHAMLGSFPAFARARGDRGVLTDFLLHVSGIVRDTIPLGTEGEGGELMLAVVEISRKGVRALTGTGPCLATVRIAGGGGDPVPLAAIPLGQSENPVFGTCDLAPGIEADLRIQWNAGEDAADQGILDVTGAKA